MTVPKQIQLLAMGNVELNQKVDNLDKKIEDLEYNLPILGIEIDRITTAVKKKGVDCLGGKNSEAYADRSLRGKVYNDIYRELKRQFGVSTYKAIKRNQCDMAIEMITGYQLPYVLADQVQFKNAQGNLWGGIRA
ncbi:MAG: ORF6C domain [Bacteriophage sp.]|nr:MAG: ORF6C domain [Bacteriophage sp.]